MAIKDLPLAPGRQHVKAFEALGWTVRRSAKNHFVLTSSAHPAVHLSIPDHRQVDRRTLKAQVRLVGISDRAYRQAFDKAN